MEVFSNKKKIYRLDNSISVKDVLARHSVKVAQLQSGTVHTDTVAKWYSGTVALFKALQRQGWPKISKY